MPRHHIEDRLIAATYTGAAKTRPMTVLVTFEVKKPTTKLMATAAKIADATGAFWKLDAVDGEAQPGGTVVVIRRGRPMYLNNDGDTIVLTAPSGTAVDTKTYGHAQSGKVFRFD